MKTETLVDRYHYLIERAYDIVSGSHFAAPYHGYIYEMQDAKLYIVEGEALLVCPKAESDWDVPSIARDEFRFPAAWLDMPDDEYAAWKAAEHEKYEAEYQARCREAEAQKQKNQEARERGLYEALKHKYEGGPAPAAPQYVPGRISSLIIGST